MKIIVVAALALVVMSGFAQPAAARSHVSFYYGSGPGCCWGAPYRGPYEHPYPPYYPRFRRPVVIVPPSAVVYEAPPVTYVAPSPVQDSIPANQTSPTFTDGYGRTCRNYETTKIVDGVARNILGTACLSSDGTWRVVD